MAHTQSTVATASTLLTSTFPHTPAKLANDWQARIARRMALDELIEPQFGDETCADDSIYPTAA